MEEDEEEDEEQGWWKSLGQAEQGEGEGRHASIICARAHPRCSTLRRRSHSCRSSPCRSLTLPWRCLPPGR